MTDLNEIKKRVIGSSEWIKFGEKFNTPGLSIFPEQLRRDLNAGSYTVGKNYFFDEPDGFKYKIFSEIVDGKQQFSVYIKPSVENMPKQKPVVKKSAGFPVSTKMDVKTIITALVILGVVFGLVFLSAPILAAFGM